MVEVFTTGSQQQFSESYWGVWLCGHFKVLWLEWWVWQLCFLQGICEGNCGRVGLTRSSVHCNQCFQFVKCFSEALRIIQKWPAISGMHKSKRVDKWSFSDTEAVRARVSLAVPKHEAAVLPEPLQQELRVSAADRAVVNGRDEVPLLIHVLTETLGALG